MLNLFPRFTNQCQHTVKIIPDENFEHPKTYWPIQPGDIWTIDLTKKNYDKEVVIFPHRKENENNTFLLKLKVYCEKHKIGIVSKGDLNQFPLLSLFSDKLILDAGSNLRGMYVGGSSYRCRLKHRPDSQEIFNAAKTIDDDEVVSYFKSMTIFVRESSYDLFNKSDLPENVAIAEIRNGNTQQRRIIRDNTEFPILGLDYKFQQSLLEKVGHHYMSFQVLGGLLKNWKFICGGGSANLFCLLPVTSLILSEAKNMFTPSTQNIIRNLSVARYGNLGHEIPIISTSTRWTHKLKITNSQWKIMRYSFHKFEQNVEIIKANLS